MERIRSVIIGLTVVLAAAIVWASAQSSSTTAPATTPNPTTVKHVDPAVVKLQDGRAQSTLRNALVAAKTDYTDSRSYLHATPEELLTIEPSLTYVDGGTPSTTWTEVSVATVSRSTWAAAVLSESGTCFFIKNVHERVSYGSGKGPCTGEAANASATDRSFPATP